MLKNLLTLLFIGLFLNLSFGQILGKKFPHMDAEDVEDVPVSLPKDTQGKFTLLGLAYSKKSENDLNTWFNPVFGKFIQENKGIFGGFGYDVNVFFIPMFTGVKAAATGTAKKKAAKNIDPQLLPYVLFYKGKLKPYKDALDFEKKDVPYFFVLDVGGNIVYATSGAYSEDKMEEIEEALQ